MPPVDQTEESTLKERYYMKIPTKMPPFALESNRLDRKSNTSQGRGAKAESKEQQELTGVKTG